MVSSSQLLLTKQEINSFISYSVTNLMVPIVSFGGLFKEVVLPVMYFLFHNDFKQNCHSIHKKVITFIN